MHKLYIIGSITEEAYAIFSEQLDTLVIEGAKEIDVDLVSEGGFANAGLAFYGKIRNCPAKITITSYGVCQSSATLIMAAGDIRRASAETVFMVHDSKVTHKGYADELLDKAYIQVNDELHWASLLAERTKMPVGTWRSLSKKTTYLNAQQALQYGLIDQILKGKK